MPSRITIIGICLGGIITYCLAFGLWLMATGLFMGPQGVIIAGLIHWSIGIVTVIILAVILQRSQRSTNRTNKTRENPEIDPR